MEILKNNLEVIIRALIIRMPKGEREFNYLDKKLSMRLSTKSELLQGEVDYHFSLMDLKREKKSIRVNRLKLRHLVGLDNIEIPNIDLELIDESLISNMRTIIDGNRDNFEKILE